MKKIILIISLLFMVTGVHAEVLLRGVVNHINLEGGVVNINETDYKIQQGKTELISGVHSLDLDLLKVGDDVKFILDRYLVTEIKLVKPYVFND